MSGLTFQKPEQEEHEVMKDMKRPEGIDEPALWTRRTTASD